MPFFQRQRTSRTDPGDPPRSFLAHLEDLRTCVIRCALAWGLCVLAMIPLCPTVLAWLRAPLARAGQDPQALVRVMSLEAGVYIVIQTMLWGGTIVSLPLLLLFVSRFVFPGLRPVERRWVTGLLVAAGAFFIAGVVMGYGYVLPVALQALMAINRWLDVQMGPLQLEDYVRIVYQTVLAFGLSFELPLLLLILGWLGLLPSRFLRDKRRHAIVIIFIIAMFLTPADSVSMVAMAVPMCLLYEVCIWLIRGREIAHGKAAGSAPDPSGG